MLFSSTTDPNYYSVKHAYCWHLITLAICLYSIIARVLLRIKNFRFSTTGTQPTRDVITNRSDCLSGFPFNCFFLLAILDFSFTHTQLIMSKTKKTVKPIKDREPSPVDILDKTEESSTCLASNDKTKKRKTQPRTSSLWLLNNYQHLCYNELIKRETKMLSKE